MNSNSVIAPPLNTFISPARDAVIFNGHEDNNQQAKEERKELKGSDTKDIIRGFVKNDHFSSVSPITNPFPPRNGEKSNLDISHSSITKSKRKADSPKTTESESIPSVIGDKQSPQQTLSSQQFTRNEGEKKQALIGTSRSSSTLPVRRIVYTSRFTCFESTLVFINILLFIGIIITSLILLRLLAFIHQKDINDYLLHLASFP